MSSLSATHVAPMAVVAGRSRPNASPPSRATVSHARRMPCALALLCYQSDREGREHPQ